MEIQRKQSPTSSIPPFKIFTVASITLVAGAAIALGAAAFHHWSFLGGIGPYPIPGAVALGVGGSMLLVDMGIVAHTLLRLSAKRSHISPVRRVMRHPLNSLRLTPEVENFIKSLEEGTTFNLTLDGQNYTVTTLTEDELDFKANFDQTAPWFETLISKKKDV